MNQVKQTIGGIFGVLIINAVIFALGFYIALQTYMSGIFPVVVWISAGIGVAQFIYVIPIIFWLRKRQQFAVMKGVIIGAVITTFLNGACYLSFFLPR